MISHTFFFVMRIWSYDDMMFLDQLIPFVKAYTVLGSRCLRITYSLEKILLQMLQKFGNHLYSLKILSIVSNLKQQYHYSLYVLFCYYYVRNFKLEILKLKEYLGIISIIYPASFCILFYELTHYSARDYRVQLENYQRTKANIF